MTEPQSGTSVLSHCDGADAVARTVGRHPTWRRPLAESYEVLEAITWLDLRIYLDESRVIPGRPGEFHLVV